MPSLIRYGSAVLAVAAGVVSLYNMAVYGFGPFLWRVPALGGLVPWSFTTIGILGLVAVALIVFPQTREMVMAAMEKTFSRRFFQAIVLLIFLLAVWAGIVNAIYGWGVMRGIGIAAVIFLLANILFAIRIIE